jgi:hypothetical protein
MVVVVVSVCIPSDMITLAGLPRAPGVSFWTHAMCAAGYHHHHHHVTQSSHSINAIGPEGALLVICITTNLLA